MAAARSIVIMISSKKETAAVFTLWRFPFFSGSKNVKNAYKTQNGEISTSATFNRREMLSVALKISLKNNSRMYPIKPRCGSTNAHQATRMQASTML